MKEVTEARSPAASPTRRAFRLTLRALLAVLVVLALIPMGFTVAGALYEPNTEIPDGFSGKHVTVKGVPLRVLQVGSGRDVLLIHGSPGSIEDWAPVTDALSASFRLTAFDRPGHGFSGDTGEYSLQHNADVAFELIEVLGLQHVIVVGHSYGGSTALALAGLRPASVGAYVIVDSAAYVPSREAGGLYRLLARPWLGRGVARVLGRLRAETRIERGIAELSGGRMPDADFVALRAPIWSSPKVAHALAEEILGSAEGLRSSSPSYPGIREPTAILGQADNEFRRTTAEHLHSDIAGSELVLVPDSGHYIQFDKSSEVIEAIRRVAGRTTR